jgi:hypothetical protein
MDGVEYHAFLLRKSEIELLDRIIAGLNASAGIIYMVHKAQEAEGDLLSRTTAQVLNHVYELLEDVLTCFEQLDRRRTAQAHEGRPPYF